MPSAVLLALVVQAHTPAADDSVRPPTATTATAVRTVHAPLIDGRSTTAVIQKILDTGEPAQQ